MNDTPQNTEQEDEYIDTATLAKQSGIPRRVIVKHIKQGILPAKKRRDSRGFRWGGCWYIHVDDVQTYVSEYGERYNIPEQSITVSELARRTGKRREVFESAIKSGELPAFRWVDKPRIAWHILEEDARNYCLRMGWTYHIPGENHETAHETSEQEIKQMQEEEDLLSIPVPTQCGSCKTIRGTLYSHVDPVTKEYLGGLCIKCKRMVDALGPKQQKDSERVLAVARYLIRAYDANGKRSKVIDS